MNRETTDKIIVYAIETQKVDNNKIRKALFDQKPASIRCVTDMRYQSFLFKFLCVTNRIPEVHVCHSLVVNK